MFSSTVPSISWFGVHYLLSTKRVQRTLTVGMVSRAPRLFANWHLADWHSADWLWPPYIWQTDIWPPDIWQADILAPIHLAGWQLADWHLADWHLAVIHLAGWHFGYHTFGRLTFGRLTFGCHTFGSLTFWPPDIKSTDIWLTYIWPKDIWPTQLQPHNSVNLWPIDRLGRPNARRPRGFRPKDEAPVSLLAAFYVRLESNYFSSSRRTESLRRSDKIVATVEQNRRNGRLKSLRRWKKYVPPFSDYQLFIRLV